MHTNNPRSISFFILRVLLLFQGISGLYGGTALVLDPTGDMLQTPLSLLEGSPFKTYLIPGIILLVALGMFPIIILYGIWRKKKWAWPGAILVSMALIIWITVEIALIGYQSNPPLQPIYGLTGIVLLILTLLPSVKTNFKTE